MFRALKPLLLGAALAGVLAFLVLLIAPRLGGFGDTEREELAAAWQRIEDAGGSLDLETSPALLEFLAKDHEDEQAAAMALLELLQGPESPVLGLDANLVAFHALAREALEDPRSTEEGLTALLGVTARALDRGTLIQVMGAAALQRKAQELAPSSPALQASLTSLSPPAADGLYRAMCRDAVALHDSLQGLGLSGSVEGEVVFAGAEEEFLLEVMQLAMVRDLEALSEHPSDPSRWPLEEESAGPGVLATWWAFVRRDPEDCALVVRNLIAAPRRSAVRAWTELLESFDEQG